MMTTERYYGEITIREWLTQHPDCGTSGVVYEGYGDGEIPLEEVLDEVDFEFTVYYDEETNYAEFDH